MVLSRMISPGLSDTRPTTFSPLTSVPFLLLRSVRCQRPLMKESSQWNRLIEGLTRVILFRDERPTVTTRFSGSG